MAAAIVFVLSCLGLSGWFFGFGAVTSGGIGVATMKFNTAFCFLASAGALVFCVAETPARRRIGDVLAALALAIGLATLVEFALRADFGIDQLLVTDAITPPDAGPGRMSAITAFEFVLFSVSVLLSRHRLSPVANFGFSVFAVAGLIVSGVALAGYLYETPLLYRPVSAASIAFSTALGFALLFTGLLASRPDTGLVALLVSPGDGGAFVRRLLPLVVVVSPLLGWFLLQGYAAGMYGTGLTVALFAVVGMLILGGATWAGGLRANQLDAERRFAFDALKESERRLAESEQRYRTMVELVEFGIWVQADGVVTYANPAIARLVGAPDADALIGREVLPFFDDDDRQAAGAFLQAAQEGGRSTGPEEFRLLGAGGAAVRVELQVIGYRRDDRWHLICICRDVTAQREAEWQLRHAQKMQAVGELTGGIAHDFNNLLTVVLGNLELALPGAHGETRLAVENAMKGGERGAALTHRLLAFSRQQPLAPERLDMNDLLNGLDELIRRTLGGEIEIEMRPSDAPAIAVADRHQVENVLLNFAINARDAMPEGGRLTIETGLAYLDAAYAARNAEVVPGTYVMVAVTDTGTGMPAEVIERAFEPFFTTKAAGKGTGLGLSMAYGFAKQSGGSLKIYSELGHGTTIRMYLPAADPGYDADDEPRDAQAVTRVPSHGGETILVVEDEAEIRAFVAAALGNLGYRVIEAENGPQALQAIESVGPVDLLFTDVIMPGGMTGRQLSDSVKAMNPEMKTLFTSGYTQSAFIRQGRLDPGIHFLPKPYRIRDVAARIREVLDGTDGDRPFAGDRG